MLSLGHPNFVSIIFIATSLGKGGTFSCNSDSAWKRSQEALSSFAQLVPMKYYNCLNTSSNLNKKKEDIIKTPRIITRNDKSARNILPNLRNIWSIYIWPCNLQLNQKLNRWEALTLMLCNIFPISACHKVPSILIYNMYFNKLSYL